MTQMTTRQRIAARHNWLLRRVKGSMELIQHLYTQGYLTREKANMIRHILTEASRSITSHRIAAIKKATNIPGSKTNERE